MCHWIPGLWKMGLCGLDSFFLTLNLILIWSLVYKNWHGGHLLNNLGLILSSIPPGLCITCLTTGPALISCVMGRGLNSWKKYRTDTSGWGNSSTKNMNFFFLCLGGYQGIYCKAAFPHPSKLWSYLIYSVLLICFAFWFNKEKQQRKHK